jgi:hypothetical protein
MSLVVKRFGFLVSFSLCLVSASNAQLKPDTTFLSASRKKIVSFYTTSIRDQSRLYNGSDYVIYVSDQEEHPYFIQDDWANGSVVYEDQLYEDVALLYNVNQDQLITEHNRGNSIKLVAEKVQRFRLFDHTFVRLSPNANARISEGFYDQLYEGESKVYAKYFKDYNETITSKEVVKRFDERVRYYLVKDNKFNVVKSKGSVINVFDDRKQEVKNFIRKNHIRFKANRAQAIVRIAEFYDTLNQ